MIFIAKKSYIACAIPVFHQYFNGGGNVSVGVLGVPYF
ncbi:hypothetical protein [Polaromonas sp. CG9_12]|nr:hypothetical protein [Polaromonas sp. CG9_12]